MSLFDPQEVDKTWIIIPILQIRKVGLFKGKWTAQGHKVK